MELRHLRYFVAVAEELHFRRAAERLHISQPPLSLQIGQLEEEIGARLFERSRQRVELTAAGRTLLTHARAVLERAEAAKQAAGLAARGEAGELRIGFTPSVKFIPGFAAALKAFRGQHPGILLSLTELDSVGQIDAIAHGRIDVGILHRPIDPVVDAVRLSDYTTDPLVLATSEDGPFARRKAVRLKDLAHESLICTPRYSGSGLYQHLARCCWRHGFVPEIVQESASLTTIAALVATGLGSAVLPDSMRALHAPGVVWRHFVGGELDIAITVATHARHEHPLADPLRSALRSSRVRARPKA